MFMTTVIKCFECKYDIV